MAGQRVISMTPPIATFFEFQWQWDCFGLQSDLQLHSQLFIRDLICACAVARKIIIYTYHELELFKTCGTYSQWTMLVILQLLQLFSVCLVASAASGEQITAVRCIFSTMLSY